MAYQAILYGVADGVAVITLNRPAVMNALTSVLRRENGYAKSDLPFEEFAWANFLRSRISAELVLADFTTASVQAKTLARSQEAQHLTGWIGAR